LTILYFDCFSGAAGDMILGALLDLGLPLEDLRRALGSLAIDPAAIWTERVTRAGVSATKFHVAGADAVSHAHDLVRENDHGHETAHVGHDRDHAPQAHSHRSLAEIYALIDRSALSAQGKDRAKHLFARLGEAEAAIHGVPVDKVHLHEVGALDSIVDIVGTVHAMEAFGADRVLSSPLNVGSGSVHSAHGLYPVPAPATTRLLEGVPIYSGPQKAELVTPTGALLITAYAQQFGGLPPMRLQRTGYGAGSRKFSRTPNVLRVLVGEGDTASQAQRVVVIEAEIDDMNPQIFGVLIDRLLTEGALDVFYTSIQMKKNRPGTLLSIIAPPAGREKLASLVFRETTTIGIRYREMDRECLDRETIAVDTPFGRVAMKVARRNGEVMNAAPEFDDCARLAAERGAPVKDVQAAAMKAFLDRP
jgi:uncharacterized protein (TIGR00299 family) protein